MKFRKVVSVDQESILAMFNALDKSIPSHELKKRLFTKQFNCEENFYGIVIEDNNKIIAYLGLIFVHRKIQGEIHKFCNLTSFLIDPAYRGQKLTHRIIDEVIKLGDYTITAITPIPSLYNMYESKGLRKLSDYRTVFWNNGLRNKNWKIISDEKLIEQNLNSDNLQIYKDHSKFNCVNLVISDENEYLLITGKIYNAQLRKFKTGRVINYFDYFLRKVFKKSFLDKKVDTLEIAFCSDYKILTKNFMEILSLISESIHVEGLILREDIIDLNSLKWYKKNRFWRARQLYLSNKLEPHQYDTLYSEIFVLDLE
jgi:hypothetical protein